MNGGELGHVRLDRHARLDELQRADEIGDVAGRRLQRSGVVDERPAADAPHHEAFLLELVERLADGGARGSERHCELAFGRQLIAVAEHAGFDGVAQACAVMALALLAGTRPKFSASASSRWRVAAAPREPFCALWHQLDRALV